MQLLTLITVALTALSVSAAPQRGWGGGRRPPTIVSPNGGIDRGTGSSGATAGSAINNNGNNNGGNAAIGNPNSNVNQASSSCANGNVVCCNGPSTNTASSNTGRQSANTNFPQYRFLLEDIFRSRVGVNANTETTNRNTSNQCEQVTDFRSGAASPICQQTVACCSGNQGPAVANVGCTAMNIVVNTGNSPVNGFFGPGGAKKE